MQNNAFMRSKISSKNFALRLPANLIQLFHVLAVLMFIVKEDENVHCFT
jgi:hypothetical protein